MQKMKAFSAMHCPLREM